MVSADLREYNRPLRFQYNVDPSIVCHRYCPFFLATPFLEIYIYNRPFSVAFHRLPPLSYNYIFRTYSKVKRDE